MTNQELYDQLPESIGNYAKLIDDLNLQQRETLKLAITLDQLETNRGLVNTLESVSRALWTIENTLANNG